MFTPLVNLTVLIRFCCWLYLIGVHSRYNVGWCVGHLKRSHAGRAVSPTRARLPRSGARTRRWCGLMRTCRKTQCSRSPFQPISLVSVEYYWVLYSSVENYEKFMKKVTVEDFIIHSRYFYKLTADNLLNDFLKRVFNLSLNF